MLGFSLKTIPKWLYHASSPNYRVFFIPHVLFLFALPSRHIHIVTNFGRELITFHSHTVSWTSWYFQFSEGRTKKGLSQVCNLTLHRQDKFLVEKKTPKQSTPTPPPPKKRLLIILSSFQSGRALSLDWVQSSLFCKPHFLHCKMTHKNLILFLPISHAVALTILSLTHSFSAQEHRRSPGTLSIFLPQGFCTHYLLCPDIALPSGSCRPPLSSFHSPE